MSEEKIIPAEQNYGPGNVLRAKREEYEWSVEAVAEALHLSTHAVNAIEADRYDDLPGATYVMGYWRSYARLLGIDIEETIEVNKRNLNIITAEAAGMDVNRLHQHKTKRGGLSGLLLLILLGAFAYYAWQQQFFGLLDGLLPVSDKVEAENTQAAPPPPEAKPVEANLQQQVLRPIKNQAAGSATENSPAPAVVEPDQQADSGQATGNGLNLSSMNDESGNAAPAATTQPGSQAGLILTPDAGSGTAASTDSTAQNLLKTPTATNQATAVSGSAAVPDTTDATEPPKLTDELASASIPASGGLATMTLTLSKDSWLDIRDKTRTRLLYKTEKAGQSIDVSGVPPFYVYIGTPDGVTIKYQGKNVPFETHKSGLFARFKLDGELLESL